MTVLNTNLGGTDPVDGQGLSAADFTDTLNELIIHRKTIAIPGDTVENFEGVKQIGTANITGVENSLLLSAKVFINGVTNSTSTTTSIFLQLSGSTLGTYYLNNEVGFVIRTGGEGQHGADWTTDERWLLSQQVSGGAVMQDSTSAPLKLLDTSMTAAILAETGGGTATIVTADIELVYVKGFKDD